MRIILSLLVAVLCLVAPAAAGPADVDPATLAGKVMCGYQGWFRCPGDASGLGWVHWSRDARRIAPDTLTFEMWPDVSEYSAAERFAAPGFTLPDGRPAELFSSDDARTVDRHFEWMRDYGLDGAWLQHFVVDLPGGPAEARYPSRRRVMGRVANSAAKTGRAWAISFDIAGMPHDRIFDVLTAEWKRLVNEGVAAGPRYLHEGGRPVVQVWGFFTGQQNNAMTPDLADRLIDFFAAPGKYAAYLVGGGDWNWRTNPDPAWQAVCRRFPAYTPWNVGNYTRDPAGEAHATTNYWADDKADFDSREKLWMPVVYPGFRWDNLKRVTPGTSAIPRRKGAFYWEQFRELARLKCRTVYVAMFDEVDEGTAVFKVTNTPPIQGHFATFEGLPPDSYLQLTREGIRLIRNERADAEEPPIRK